MKNSIDKLKSLRDIQNKIIIGDTLSNLKKIPSNSINSIITSPSYFLKKSYESDESFMSYMEFHNNVIVECKRILKKNGSIFWNVAQSVQDNEMIPLGAIFYKSFRDIDLYLKNWIIWKFEGGECPRSRLFGRYENVLWFVKDKKDYVFNIDDIRVPTKWVKDKRVRNEGKNPEDFWLLDERTNTEKLQNIKIKINKFKKLISTKTDNYIEQILMDELSRDIEIELDEMLSSKDKLINKNLKNNIWYINRVVNVSKKEKIKHPTKNITHPCPFPERLIERLIKMSSSKNDTVLDIFSGSGTVLHVANKLKRKWIGIDKEIEYCEIAEHRIKNY